MPARVPENPGGRVTSVPTRFWSPSRRVRSKTKSVWLPPVLSVTPAAIDGLNGLAVGGQGVPLGPESIVKNWVEVCSGRSG